MEMGWTARLMLFFGGLFFVTYLIGLTIPKPEPNIKPWVKDRGNPRDVNVVKKSWKQTQTKTLEYDWQKDKDDETIEWHEFLEEVENRGLTPFDTESQEIWDNNYR